MKKSFLIPLMIVSLFFAITSANAQDNGEEVYDDLEYTYGSVVSVSPGEVVIKEYNYESDEEVQVAYAVNPETKFNKVSSVAELAPEDNVDIYYKVVGEQKIAQVITKDDTQYDTEPEEGDLEDMDANAVNVVVPADIPPVQNESDPINASRG